MAGPLVETRHPLGRIARVACLVAMCLVVLDVLLSLTFGLSPRLLGRDELVDPDNLQTITARVAAVERQLASERPGQPKLAVVVGLSTAREGLDARRFRSDTGDRYRMLNLAASGGSISEMRSYTEPLLSGGLRPDLVLVAVHPSWLAGRNLRAPLQSAPRLGPSGLSWPALHTYGLDWRVWLPQHSWILSNRSAIHAELRKRMLSARARIGTEIGMPLSALVPGAHNDPWVVRSYYGDDHADPAFLTTQLRQWEAIGWFDESRLGGDAEEAQVIRELLQALQAISKRVVLVLMPEATAFQSRVPERGANTMRQLAASAQPAIQVLDLRRSLPPSAFRDQVHLNRVGRLQFTALIAERLLALDNEATATTH